MSDEIDELTDVIIEDTVHCDLCGASWVLGGCEDGIILQLPRGRSDFISGQLKLCCDCAAFVSLTYSQFVAEKDVCEHGVLCGDWCERCNRAYKAARAAGSEDG